MNLNFVLASLISTMTLALNEVTPGKVKLNYDQFKNETTITVIGQQVKGQPVLQVLDSFPGHKPDSHRAMKIGFLVPNGCPFPNFVANGKHVKPDPSSKNTLGIDPTPIIATLGGNEQVYTFVFNFYQPQDAAQIATAKTVKYKICDEVFTLAPQDQQYLRQIMRY